MSNGENATTDTTLQEATTDQMSEELSRRGLAHLLITETVKPGPGGKVQARVFVKTCIHKAGVLLKTLSDVVDKTFNT